MVCGTDGGGDPRTKAPQGAGRIVGAESFEVGSGWKTAHDEQSPP